MSGVYRNWIKVQNPNMSNDIPQMESGGSQVPFYFGGSYVPTYLHKNDTNLNMTGKGLKNYRKTCLLQEKKGKGIQKTFHNIQSNIHIPRQLKF